MKVTIKTVNLSKSIFDQLPDATVVDMTVVMANGEVSGIVIHKRVKYALLQGNRLSRLKLLGEAKVCGTYVNFSGPYSRNCLSKEKAEAYCGLYNTVRKLALEKGQVFL